MTGRVASPPGSRPPGHAGCAVDGAARFDPSRCCVDQNAVAGALNWIWEQMDLRDKHQACLGRQIQRLIDDIGGFHWGGPGAEPKDGFQCHCLASAMSAGAAETAQQAQGQRLASAVPEGETPTPSHQGPNHE